MEGIEFMPIKEPKVVVITSKECKKCKKVKLLDEFYNTINHKQNRLGVTSQCKSCVDVSNEVYRRLSLARKRLMNMPAIAERKRLAQEKRDIKEAERIEAKRIKMELRKEAKRLKLEELIKNKVAKKRGRPRKVIDDEVVEVADNEIDSVN